MQRARHVPAGADRRRHSLDGGIADRAGIAAASDGAVVLYHHLPTHSPWRRFTPGLNRVPARARLHLLHEPRLPRLSPFHLDRGPRAFELAREMTLRSLAGPSDERNLNHSSGSF